MDFLNLYSLNQLIKILYQSGNTKKYIKSIILKNLEFITPSVDTNSGNIKTRIDIVKFKFIQDGQLLIDSLLPSSAIKFLNQIADTDESFYNSIPETTKHLKIFDAKDIDASKLPKGLTDLSLCFDDNQSLLLKPKQQSQHINDTNNRFNYSEPLTKDSPLFYFIWKNKYIRNNIFDKLINPSRDVIQLATRLKKKRERMVLSFDHRNIEKYGNSFVNFSLWGVKKVVFNQLYLNQYISPIPQPILNLVDGKYHLYKKGEPIPNGTTHVIWQLNECIPSNTIIPDSCQSIIFGDEYNQPILPNTLGNNIFEIQFGSKFDLDLSAISFPSNLKSLTISSEYQYLLDSTTLPNTLRYLSIKEIGSIFSDVSIVDFISKKLRNLPPQIDHLRILYQETYPYMIDLQNISPYIKYVKIDNGTLECVNYVIPATVKCLTMLPAKNYSYRIGDKKEIYVSERNRDTKEASTIELDDKLIFQKRVYHMDKLIYEKVDVQVIDNQQDDENTNSNQDSVEITRLDTFINLHILVKKIYIAPSSLLDQCIKSMTICTKFAISPGSLPNSLEYLSFIPKYGAYGGRFNQPLQVGVLPRNLKTLIFSDEFNQPILPGVLPNGLEELEFGKDFEQSLASKGIFPPTSLKKLIFKRGYYDEQLFNWIPSSVNELRLGYFRTEIDTIPIEKVPQSITTLSWSTHQTIESLSSIPQHIKHIKIGGCKKYDQLPSTIESIAFNSFQDHLLYSLILNPKQ